MNISNRHVNHTQVREFQIPKKTEESLLLHLQIKDNSNSEGTIPY